ncbi:MAG: glycosyltransferase family 4 protein [candidate division WS1 bacterium]|jgi:glycosyltransferase involved in cell wall biosynthesis|nr:glycosyltransferase family 4 protein [candidate division WS1 bacterium]
MSDRRLRIGIDARAISYPKTGDRSYTLGLIDGLARLRRGGTVSHEFVLYFDQEPPEQLSCAAENALDPGWSVHVLGAPHGRLWTLQALPRAAKEDGIDVLHVQYNGPRIRRPALVTTVHDISFRLHPEWFPLKDRLLLDLGLRSTLSVARHVFAVSEFTRAGVISSYGVPPERVSVTYNALPPAFTAPDEAAVERVLAAHGLSRPYVLFVGVRQPRKNLPRTVAAFVSAKQSGALPHRLVLAGKAGWRATETERAIAEAGEDVLPLGYVPDEDLPALYAGADLLLFPSLLEGFGIPVLEAFACGTPVVTSDESALPEIAGDAALLVNPRDEEGIAGAILRVLNEPTLRDELVRRGFERLRLFDWQETARRTVAGYERAVEVQ